MVVVDCAVVSGLFAFLDHLVDVTHGCGNGCIDTEFPCWTKVPEDSVRALQVSTSSPIYGKVKKERKDTAMSKSKLHNCRTTACWYLSLNPQLPTSQTSEPKRRDFYQSLVDARFSTSLVFLRGTVSISSNKHKNKVKGQNSHPPSSSPHCDRSDCPHQATSFPPRD